MMTPYEHQHWAGLEQPEALGYLHPLYDIVDTNDAFTQQTTRRWTTSHRSALAQ